MIMFSFIYTVANSYCSSHFCSFLSLFDFVCSSDNQISESGVHDLVAELSSQPSSLRRIDVSGAILGILDHLFFFCFFVFFLLLCSEVSKPIWGIFK
jgi:hypothetical protein